MQGYEYSEYILDADVQIVREIQDYCADLHDEFVEREERLGRVDGVKAWTEENAEHVAALLNRSKHPRSLFRFIDKKPGNSTYVGYQTRDGREWFHILRQMRNTRGSGLLENIENR
jgi:hypothetical protein